MKSLDCCSRPCRETSKFCSGSLKSCRLLVCQCKQGCQRLMQTTCKLLSVIIFFSCLIPFVIPFAVIYCYLFRPTFLAILFIRHRNPYIKYAYYLLILYDIHFHGFNVAVLSHMVNYTFYYLIGLLMQLMRQDTEDDQEIQGSMLAVYLSKAVGIVAPVVNPSLSLASTRRLSVLELWPNNLIPSPVSPPGDHPRLILECSSQTSLVLVLMCSVQ